MDGGVLLIDSRAHRTQAQNREAARERLADLIAVASTSPKRRRATRPTPSSHERRIDTKKKRGAVKANRGKAGDRE